MSESDEVSADHKAVLEQIVDFIQDHIERGFTSREAIAANLVSAAKGNWGVEWTQELALQVVNSCFDGLLEVASANKEVASANKERFESRVEAQVAAWGLDEMNKEERKNWAEEKLEVIGKITDGNESAKEIFSELEAMLAGMAMSPWLPSGMARKAIMFGSVGAGVFATLTGNLGWVVPLLLFSFIFSPRIVGEGTLINGSAPHYKWIIMGGYILLYWLWPD